MANDANRNKRRRRKRGVPTALVIILLVIALLMGGLAGFAIARQTDPNRERLMEAQARIVELENTLTLIGFSPEYDDPDNWVPSGGEYGTGTEDLSGGTNDGGSDLWVEQGVLTGTLDETGDPVVVAEFDGGELLSTEVIPEYNDQLTTQIFAGYKAEEIADSVLMTVMSYMVTEKLIAIKSQELGLDELTEEDLAEIDAQAAEIYDDQMTYYTAFVAQPGMSQAEVNAAAAKYMEEENGITKQSIAEEIKATWPTQKFYNYTVREVTVSDEEVQSYYAETLAQQKATFAQYPEEYEYAHVNGDTILYNPAGYRAVRNLLIPFDSDEAAAQAADLLDQLDQLNPDTDATRIEAIQEQLDALYAPLEATAQEIIQMLQDGATFSEVLKEYGADEMMDEDPLGVEGYYISDNSFLFSTEFIEGCMMLEKAGDVSAPLRSASGIHLVELVGEVPSGDVPLDDVREAMEAAALEIKCDEYYSQQTAAMLEAAHVRYYPERLQ